MLGCASFLLVCIVIICQKLVTGCRKRAIEKARKLSEIEASGLFFCIYAVCRKMQLVGVEPIQKPLFSRFTGCLC